MTLFQKFMAVLSFEIESPEPYGWFHLFFLAAMLAACALIIMRCKNDSDEKARRVILTLSVICLCFELYKQLVFSYNLIDGAVVWRYQWYAFPFQFCSTPMYVGFIAALIKKGSVQSSMYAFLASFSIAGGLSVMLYPATVFMDLAGISVQTMVHHGCMVIMGVYLLASRKVPARGRTIFRAIPVFLTLVATAIAIDVATYYAGINGGLEMFFISPFHVSSLPVLSAIYPKVPYIVFLGLYLFAFVSAGYLVLRASALVADASRKSANKRRFSANKI